MITFNRSIIHLSLLALVYSALDAQELNIRRHEENSKIDPALLQALSPRPQTASQQLRTFDSYPAGKVTSLAGGDAVGVLIRSTGNVREYVRSLGGITGSRHGDIYTAIIPLNSIPLLADRTDIGFIEASRRLFPSLDLSRAKTGADVLQAFPGPNRRLTGKGVIIGFTDSGINTDHPNFKTPDGRTRILYVWDQYASGGGVPPVGFTYGIEKDSSAINAHTWSMSDYGLHGTHVSGIAAGNGLPLKQYIGIAPEADIVMVSNYGDDLFNRGLTTVGTLDGYDYIRTKANALGKRYVINTSQGTNLGPHDGTTLFEQAVDADVAAGNIHCISAGNEATSARHASATVTTSAPREIQCSLSGDASYGIPMDIWYHAGDRLELQAKEFSSPSYTTLFPAVDSTITISIGSVILSVTTKIGSPLNGDNEIYITFLPQTFVTGLVVQLKFSATSGNLLPDGGRVDLWWERNYNVSFVTDVDASMTLGMPACADSAITVASYNNRAGYGAVDDISFFSGQGPRRDGVLKPDIAGIGGMVMSSVGPSGYDMFSGTSMSSPHVAGAVALLLQQDSSLTNAQIKNKLIASATADPFTGSVPNPTWGYGKLNVLKAAGYRGLPIINLSRDTLRFPFAFIGRANADSVEVQNLGNEALTVSSVTTSDPIYSVTRTSFTVAPRSKEWLVVTVTPTAVGNLTGQVTISSDDSTRLTSTIAILGHSDYPPVISVNPDSLHFSVFEQDSASAPLTINNSGAGTLYWSTTGGWEGTLQTKRFTLPSRPVTGPAPDSRATMSTGGVAHSVTDKFADLSGKRVAITNFYSYSIIAGDLASRGARVYDLFSPVSSSMLDTIDIVAVDDMLTSMTFSDITALREWVQSGHGLLVQGDDQSSMYFINTLMAGSGITEYSLPGYFDGYFTNITPHPITTGVDTVVSMSYGSYCDANPPALVLVRDDAARPHIILSAIGSGQVIVACNEIAQDYNFSSFAGDTRVLSNNIFDWLAGEASFVRVDPLYGTVSPGGSEGVTVFANARRSGPGQHSTDLRLYNNDPIHDPFIVPVSMSVTGKPVIRVAPDTLKYGVAYIGVTRVDTVRIRNIGSDQLQITGVACTDTAFHLSATTFAVPPGGLHPLLVTFTASSVGPFAATITITSNDSSALHWPVPLTGEAAYPPVITVAPDSLSFTLHERDSTAGSFTIGNAGLGVLLWDSPQGDTSGFGFSMRLQAKRTPVERIAVRHAGGQGNNIGTPTIAPYTLSSLLQMSGPMKVLLWAAYADDSPGGELENTMNAILQYAGNVTFDTSRTTSPSDFALRLAQSDMFVMPEQELAGDLSSFGTAFASALASYVQNGRTIVVLDYWSGGSTTLLNATGLLTINVLGTSPSLTAVVDDSTSVLVEGVSPTFTAMNGSNYHSSPDGRKIVREQASGYNMVTQRDVGFGRVIYIGMDFFSYNNDMARLLANTVTSSAGAGLLSIRPASGIVQPSGSQPVDVKVKAGSIVPGVHRSSIVLHNNDPLRNPRTVSVKISVLGKPVIDLDPDTLNFGIAYVGVPRQDTLRVRNIGSVDLIVGNVTATDTAFHFNHTSFTVSPRGVGLLLITSSAKSLGPFSGSVSIFSNDSSSLVTTVPFFGAGEYPPAITISPDSLSLTLRETDSTARSITISNAGLGNLHWQFGSATVQAFGSMADMRDRLFGPGSQWKKWTPAFSSDRPATATYTKKQVPAGAEVRPAVKSRASGVALFPLFGTTTTGIQQVDPATGGIIRTFPMTLNGGPDGLAYDGTSLYVLPGYSSCVYVMNSVTGVISDSLTSLPSLNCDGLATDGRYLFMMDYNLSLIYAIDLATKTTVGTLHPPVVIGGGISFSSRRGTLFASNFGTAIYELDVLTGAVLHTLPVPSGAQIYGVAYSNSSDLLAVSGSGSTYILNPNTGAVVSSFPGGYSGLAGDEAYGVIFSMAPDSGSLAPQATQQASLTVKSDHAIAGRSRYAVSIHSNDPLHDPALVWVNLHVKGVPRIALSPDSLVNVKAYAGVVRHDTIHVKNPGTDELSVSSIVSNDTSWLKVDKTSLTVPAHAEGLVLTSFAPHDTGAFRFSITISSNDSSRPVMVWSFAGRASYPPDMAVSPDSFAVHLVQGDSIAQYLTIANRGVGPLTWESPQGKAGGPGLKAAAVGRTSIEGLAVLQSSRQGNNKGTPTVSAFGQSALLGRGGSKRVLLWTPYADTTAGGEAENTMNAILMYENDVAFDTSMTSSPENLAARLAQTDVFIVPEQELAGDLSGIGASFASALTEFVLSGRTIIVLDYTGYGSTTLLNATGLLTINVQGTSVTTLNAMVHDTSSVLVAGVPRQFVVMNGSNYHFSPDGRKIVREILSGNNMVTLKDVAEGRIIYIGMDFFSYNSDMARLLANAVTSSYSSRCVVLDPGAGTVAPGDTQRVAVSISARYLKAGKTNTRITLKTNDPIWPVKTIPVLVDVSPLQSVSDAAADLPRAFELFQNYPNPFNPSTMILYDLPKAVHVTLVVYNILGQRVATLVNENQRAGHYRVRWDGGAESGKASGVYFVNIRTGEFAKTVKMMLMK